MRSFVIVLLALVAAAVASSCGFENPTTINAASTTFGKLKLKSSSFCLPLTHRPNSDNFEATIKFVFNKPTPLNVQFKDTVMHKGEEVSDMHSVRIHLPHRAAPWYNTSPLFKYGIVAGVITAPDAQLLGIKYEFTAEESDLVAVADAEKTCKTWMQAVDAFVGDHGDVDPKPTTRTFVSPFSIMILGSIFLCAVVLPCTYALYLIRRRAALAAAAKAEADLAVELVERDNNESNDAAPAQVQSYPGIAPTNTMPYVASNNVPYNVVFIAPQYYPMNPTQSMYPGQQGWSQ